MQTGQTGQPALPSDVARADVTIVEVGPRDGLQNHARQVPTPIKLMLIERLAAAGLKRIEIASFVDPRRVPQMADAEAVVAGCRDLAGVSRSGLVLNEKGLGRALASEGLEEINFAAMTSETFSLRNQGMSVRDNLGSWRRISRRAEAAGLLRTVTISTAFGCPFEKDVPVARVVEIARDCAQSGVDEIALADTIGVADPAAVGDLFRLVGEAVPGIPLRAHFHDTRGTGYASTIEAMRAGARALDASFGGLGGCPFAPGAPGNIATERLLDEMRRHGVRQAARSDEIAPLLSWLEGCD